MSNNCTGCFWFGRCDIVFGSSVCIQDRKNGKNLSTKISNLADRLDVIMDDLNSSVADGIITEMRQISSENIFKNEW